MLKLSTSYMKKIPVGGTDFSSQSFHASVELELSDALTPEQIRAKIHDSAALLRQAVDDELSGVPHENGGASQPQSGSQRQHAPAQERKASNAQIKYLTDLAAEQKIPLQDLNADVQRRFGVSGIYDLTSKQASAVLDDLKGAGQRRMAA